jgi:hypothetical protein
MSTSDSVKNRMLTPLWVISLFISLAETVTGVAATQTSGGIQVALTVFVILFPILIAVGFFLLLWQKPHHLYAPAEYGKQVGVSEYIDAITRNQSANKDKLYETIQDSVQSNLTSPEMISEITKIVSKKNAQHIDTEITRILDNIANKTIATIRDESFLTIDPTPIIGDQNILWQMNYSQYNFVYDFLDDVYLRLTNRIELPTFTYGRVWALRDSKTGHVFKELGSNWAGSKGGKSDIRTLEAVGFFPGMKLEATYI